MTKFVYHFKSRRLEKKMKDGRGNKGVAITAVVTASEPPVIGIAINHRKDGFSAKRGAGIASGRVDKYLNEDRWPEFVVLPDGFSLQLDKKDGKYVRPKRWQVADAINLNITLSDMHKGLLNSFANEL